MLYLFYKLRYLFLALTTLVCIFLWPGVRSAIVVDNSLTVWFLENDPALVSYNTFQDRFGNDEMVILVVKDKQSVLAPSYVNAFIRMTEALEAIPEVAGVIGPANVTVGSGATPQPLLKPNTDAAEVKQALAHMPVMREHLFTPDYKVARFMIVLKTVPDFDSKRGAILDKVKNTIAQHLPENNYHLGGVGVIFAALNTLSQHDFGFFLGLGYLIMFLLLWWIYRRPLLLIYALGTVALATYVTLGIYGTLGYRLNLMTTLLPIIIILLGIMDVMHVLNERSQLQQQSGGNDRERALYALRSVFKPCLYTSLTTMAGFLALVASPMAILQQFGIFSALGILLSFIFTYVLGLIILPVSKPVPTTSQKTGTQLVKLLALVLQKKKSFALLSFCLAALSLIGISFIKTDTYTLGYFPKDHQVVQDHEQIEALWGPYMPLELLIHPKAGKALHDKEVVQAAKTFADSARTISGVGQVFGFQSLYQAGLEARYKNKGSRMLQSQFYLNQAHKELGQNYPDLIRQFEDDSSQTGRITVFGSMTSAKGLTAKMDTLMVLANASLGKVATVTPSGYQPMYANIVQYVTRSQINSLLLALVLVFLLVWLFIKNLKLAILSVVPNFFPVILMLGVMGWTGIALDTATASIAAIVLSFCIDDTIHFIYYYQQQRREGKSASIARVSTMEHVGPAIVLTSTVLFLGYGFMIFGSLKTVALFGVLTAVSIAGALYSQLFIFPQLLQRFDK